MHQHPGTVPARAARLRQRLLGRPNPRLQPNDVADAVPHGLVHPHQVVNRALPCWLQPGHQLGQERPRRFGAAESGQLGLEHRIVAERDGLGVAFQEEGERVDGRHIGQQVDRDFELRHPLREHRAGEEIALRILLPIEEVPGGLHGQRIGQDPGAAMRRWAQADGLRPKLDWAVVAVAGSMRQGYVQRH